MKIAFVSDDGKTISAHLGRAAYYVIVQVEDGQILSRQLLHKGDFHAQREEKHGCGSHDHADREHRGLGEHAEEKHSSMFASIVDCDLLIARGMGYGAKRGLQQLGIQPLLTDIRDIDQALQAYLAGRLEEHPERVH